MTLLKLVVFYLLHLKEDILFHFENHSRFEILLKLITFYNLLKIISLNFFHLRSLYLRTNFCPHIHLCSVWNFCMALLLLLNVNRYYCCFFSIKFLYVDVKFLFIISVWNGKRFFLFAIMTSKLKCDFQISSFSQTVAYKVCVLYVERKLFCNLGLGIHHQKLSVSAFIASLNYYI